MVSLSICWLAGLATMGNPIGSDSDRPLEISLSEAMSMAMENNLGLATARAGVAITDTTIQEAIGAFDPVFFMTASGGRNSSPSASLIDRGDLTGLDLAFIETQNEFLRGSAGISGLTPFGMTYQLQTNASKSKRDPQGFTALNPLTSSDLSLTVTQPLLRGFGGTANKGPLYQARLGSERARLDLETQMLTTGFNVISAYWDYVFAIKTVDTRETALTVAKELLDINQKKLKAGVFTYIDVIRAEDEVKRREEDLIRAVNQKGDAEDRLRRTLFTLDDREAWAHELIPTTEPQSPESVSIDWAEVANQTLNDRPDLRSSRLGLKNLKIGIDIAKRDALPDFSVNATYGFNGLGTNFDDSYDLLDNRDFPNLLVGISLEVPIGNRARSARLERAELQQLQAEIQLRDLEAQAVEEVRRAIRALEAGERRISAARESHALAKELYEKERKRLNAGEGTAFQVREAERDLFEARDSEVRAIIDYQLAKADLARARGSLLIEYGIPLPEPLDRDDAPVRF